MNWLKRWRGEKMGKPKIRFKGYTEDWEQRKLSDIYGSIGNAFVGTATPYYAEQGHFYLESNNVKDGQINHNSEVFINDEFYEKQKDKWLHTGDMVMVQSGHVGHAAVISEELDNTAAHALIMFRNPKEEIEPYFLNYEYQTDKAKKKIENITTGNIIKHILASDMQEFVVDVPKYEEQKVIADYFRNLDHIITLHQRKCDEAKKLKKCMLQKMFPKDGEKVPEIRFSGFTSDWKQRKLEEIVNRITRKNSKLISELPLTISAQQGLIDQNEFFDKRVASKDVSGYYLIKNGEFAYNKSTSNDAPWGAIKRLDRYENGVLSTLYIVFEIKDETLVNSDFLVAYYSTNLWHKGIHEIAAEGARNHGLLNIAPTDFFKTKLKLPADIEEQKEIGEYFKKIDLLITFHHRKLNILNKICRYAWEQRKLGELYQRNTERNENLIGYDKTISVATMSYKDDGNGASESSLSTYKVLRVGDIAFEGHTNKQFRFGRFVVNDIGTGIMSPRFSTLRPLNEMPVNFWKQYIHSEAVMRRILVNSTKAGTMMNELVIPEFLNQTIMVPSENEQAVIGQYFTNLDHLITLHQQKCKQLQIIRKFMLQNIFL